MPSVFISYSHDSPAHAERVLELANRLREEGLHTILDQYEENPAQGWPKWMDQNLAEADWVLAVCTEVFTARASGKAPAGTGKGVRWESTLAYQHLYDAGSENHRFIPVIFEAADSDHIPTPLRGATWYVLPSGYDDLYRRLTRQRKIVPPEVGAVKTLPPEPPPTGLFSETDDKTNPYDPWRPAIPPHFVGRERELRALELALEEGRSVSLVGDWRIGKTSLLRTWHRRQQTGGRVLRLLDGLQTEGASMAAFAGAVCGETVPDHAERAGDSIDAWARANTRAGLPPLILVDEFGTVIERLDHRFLERLRGLLGRIVLVLTSRRELDLIYEQMGRTSPFQNQLEVVTVGLLEPASAQALIRRGDKKVTDADQALLQRQAGRHPYHLQLLGRCLVDAHEQGMTREEAKDRYQTEAFSRLREVWNTLTTRDRTTLTDVLYGKAQGRLNLRNRGLLTRKNELFGEVLADFLQESAE